MKASRLWLPLIVVGVLVWCGAYVLGPSLAGRLWYARETARLKAIRENLPHLSQADSLSTLFREVSKAVKPAVVEVRVVQDAEIRGPELRRRFNEGAIGSGVIIDAENGYIVTNEHVISGAETITVVLADGREINVAWVRSDRMSDLAVIKIDAKRLIDIPMGDSDAVEVGDLVLAVGSPIRLRQTVTFGMISAKGRMYGRSDKYQNYLQTDAAINHGNSGGPLINMSGEIVGINVAIVSPSGTNAGLGLSIPSNMVKRVSSQLIKDGKVTRGFIGLAFREVDEEMALELDLPDTKGALVILVAPDGPADEAGIRVGDFIVTIDSQPVPNTQKLRHIIANIAPGTTIPVKFYRDGQTAVVSVKIQIQPDNMSEAFRP